MNARERSNHLAALLRNERSAMTEFLLDLADFDRQKMWRDLGHASLFSYLRRELGLSAGAAQYRKTAAELIQQFPEIEPALRDGRLCLSTVIEVAKVLTAENQHEVLPRFFGLSRREAEALAASIRPAEVVPRRDVVTAVRAAALVVAGVPRAPTTTDQVPDVAVRPAEVPSPAPSEPPPPVAAPPPRDEAKPLDGASSRLHVTVSRRFLAKLEAARDALSHAKPGAATDEILEAGLDLLLAKHAKSKGLVEKPRKAAAPSRSDAVPAHVKRAVWQRAGGRCEFRLESGEVCGSTYQLEFDHHPVPRARGGLPTIENIRLACRPHNQLAARRLFGDQRIDRHMGRTTKTVAPPDAPAACAVRGS